MRKLSKVSLLTALLALLALPALCMAEEDFAEILKRAQTLKDQGKFTAAMEELSWATKQLQTLHTQKLEAFLPEKLLDFTGGQVQSNSAMGFMNIERTYSGAPGKVKLSLSGSASSGGAAAQGLGALANLAGMAAMMGNAPGMDTVRVKDQRATVESANGEMKLTIPMSNGIIFSAEQTEGKVTKEQLVALAESFDFAGLNAYVATK